MQRSDTFCFYSRHLNVDVFNTRNIIYNFIMFYSHVASYCLQHAIAKCRILCRSFDMSIKTGVTRDKPEFRIETALRIMWGVVARDRVTYVLSRHVVYFVQVLTKVRENSS